MTIKRLMLHQFVRKSNEDLGNSFPGQFRHSGARLFATYFQAWA